MDVDGRAPIAFVTAMPMEQRPLAKALHLTRTTIAGTPARTGSLDRAPVVAVVTGMGTALAAAGVERLFDALTPRGVLMVGIAGAVDDDTPIGSLVVPARVVDASSGRSYEHEPVGTTGHGVLWTTDGITSVDHLAALRDRGVVALDMETAAVAEACEHRGVPW